VQQQQQQSPGLDDVDESLQESLEDIRAVQSEFESLQVRDRARALARHGRACVTLRPRPAQGRLRHRYGGCRRPAPGAIQLLPWRAPVLHWAALPQRPQGRSRPGDPPTTPSLCLSPTSDAHDFPHPHPHLHLHHHRHQHLHLHQHLHPCPPPLLQGSGLFPPGSIAKLHGRMAGEEKARVLEEFRTGATRLLVASTVVEVGVDVPDASVMLVEHADRWGEVGGADGPGLAAAKPGAHMSHVTCHMSQCRRSACWPEALGPRLRQHPGPASLPT
jgi:hypothetical protein